MVELSDKGPGGLNLITATEVAQKIAAGETTSEAVVSDCLNRIEARDPQIQAWKFLDPDAALAQAKERDNEASRGCLHGVPVGIKDILNTADMPTEFGSSLFNGYQPKSDCTSVAALRAAGAVILGKTVTTEFASPYPTYTLNPHDLKSTPGVSSAGSAAAVADYMVPLTNGTQTGGSVIRPAALCGVYGYKASLKGLDPAGIEMWKPNIDTLGHFGRSLEDIALMSAALTGNPVADLKLPAGFKPRVGICRTGQWPAAGPENTAMIEKMIAILTDAGIDVEETDFPTNFDDVMAAHGMVVGADSVKAFPETVTSQLDKVNPWTRDRSRDARQMSESDVKNAHRIATDARTALSAEFERFDLLLTPSAEGEAETDRTAMPPPSFNSLWTLMYTPCVSLPAFTGPNDMPVGLQIVGPENRDDRTLALAHWVEQRITDACGGGPTKL